MKTNLTVKDEEKRRKGFAVVRQSVDPQWTKWAVIYPDSAKRNTEWHDEEYLALNAADLFNGRNL